MARDYQEAVASKRPPVSKYIESKRLVPTTSYSTMPQDKNLKKCHDYIEKVRKTGVRWNHHVARLERKYQSNIVKIYQELTADVKANNKKKEARKKDKSARHRKTHGDTPPTSSADSSNSAGTSSGSSSNASGHTFSSLGITQTMIEKQRGRPRKRSIKPSHLSQQTFLRRDSAHQSQPEADSARFSLSDEGSSAPDIGLMTDTSYGTNNFDEPDPEAAADFWAELPPPLTSKIASEKTAISSDAPRPSLRIKLKTTKQAKSTEASSEGEDSQWLKGVHNQPSNQSLLKAEDRQKTRQTKASKVPSHVTTPPSSQPKESRPSTSRKARASATAESPPPRQSNGKRSHSEITISAAIEDLYSDPENSGPAHADVQIQKQDYPAGKQDLDESSQERPRKPLSKGKRRKLQAVESVDSLAAPASANAVAPKPLRTKSTPRADRNIPPWQNYQEEQTLPNPRASNSINDAIPRSSTEPPIDPDVAQILNDPDGISKLLAGYNAAPSTSRNTIQDNLPNAPERLPSNAPETNAATFREAPYPSLFNGANNMHNDVTMDTMGGQALQQGLRNDGRQPIYPLLQGHSMAPAYVPEASNGLHENSQQQDRLEYPDSGIQVHPTGVPANTANGPGNDVPAAGIPRETTTTNIPAKDVLIKDIKINEGLVHSLADLDFTKLSDFTSNGMGKEEIRLFIAAIADELKLRKPETLAAIFKVTAAVLRYQEGISRGV